MNVPGYYREDVAGMDDVGVFWIIPTNGVAVDG